MRAGCEPTVVVRLRIKDPQKRSTFTVWVRWYRVIYLIEIAPVQHNHLGAELESLFCGGKKCGQRMFNVMVNIRVIKSIESETP